MSCSHLLRKSKIGFVRCIVLVLLVEQIEFDSFRLFAVLMISILEHKCTWKKV